MTAAVAKDTYTLEEALKELGKDINKLADDMVNQGKKALPIFAGQVLNLIVGKAKQEFGNNKRLMEIYEKNISMKKVEATEGTSIYYIQLHGAAGFIEQGKPRHSMLDYLLKGPKAKKSADGSTYNVIPFSHNKTASKVSPQKNEIIKFVNKELKQRGLDKIVTRDGKPVLGAVARLNLSGPTSKFNKPLLSGLTVYQSEMRNKRGEAILDKKTGKAKIKRDVLTFRTASSKQIGSGLWESPGVKAYDIFEKVQPELDQLWSTIVKNLGSL